MVTGPLNQARSADSRVWTTNKLEGLPYFPYDLVANSEKP